MKYINFCTNVYSQERLGSGKRRRKGKKRYRMKREKRKRRGGGGEREGVLGHLENIRSN